MSEPKTDGGTPYPEKVPVVKYWKHSGEHYGPMDPLPYCVTIDGPIAECPQVPRWVGGATCNSYDWFWISITEEEYYSANPLLAPAKQPAPDAKVIELLDPLDSPKGKVVVNP